MWSMIKTSLCNRTNFLLWSAMSKTSLGIGMERRRLKSTFTWTVLVVGYEKDSQQENSYHHHRSSVPNCTTFCVEFSCFHKYITFLWCTTKIFLIRKPSWDNGLKLGFKTQSWLYQSTRLYHFNNSKLLRQQPRASVIRKYHCYS